MPTLTELETDLEDWFNALRALQKGQQYTIGGIRNGRQLVRADLPEVRETIDWYKVQIAEAKAAAQGGTGINVGRLVV